VKRAIWTALSVRDPAAPEVRSESGEVEPDPDLREYEMVPLGETVDEYMKREVLPFVLDAWAPDPEGREGYEFPFTRFFYRPEPLRPVEEVDRDIQELELEVQRLLAEALG